jgi:hypothetical protein
MIKLKNFNDEYDLSTIDPECHEDIRASLEFMAYYPGSYWEIVDCIKKIAYYTKSKSAAIAKIREVASNVVGATDAEIYYLMMGGIRRDYHELRQWGKDLKEPFGIEVHWDTVEDWDSETTLNDYFGLTTVRL